MSARELAALVFLAVLAAVGAIGATAWDISRRAHLLPPQPAFADFDQAKGGLVQIRIETAEEAVTLVRADGDRWTVEEADFFPAKSPTVNRLVKGMRDLQLVEPKTNLPANHARLMVADPAEVPGGTRFTSYDLNGDVVTDFVTGTYVSKPTPGEVSMLFIRNTAQDQVWLAEGDLSVATEVRQWLDQDLRLPEFDGVVSVEVKPLKAIAYRSKEMPRRANLRSPRRRKNSPNLNSSGWNGPRRCSPSWQSRVSGSGPGSNSARPTRRSSGPRTAWS